MFKIFDGRENFYQWDLNRKLIVEDATINEVHFCNGTDSCSLVVMVYEEEGKRLANVPNILLQNDWRINVYGYDKSYTKHSAAFKVIKRSKPEDYVYTETEIKRYDDLKARIDEIEKQGVPEEAMNAAIGKYLEENPIDLTEYALKTDLNEFVSMEQVELKGFQTKGEVLVLIDDALGVVENGTY